MLRFCVDYGGLNTITKMDTFLLPRINGSLNLLANTFYFTLLDLMSGYWQVGMDPESQLKTAFCYHSELNEYIIIPWQRSRGSWRQCQQDWYETNALLTQTVLWLLAEVQFPCFRDILLSLAPSFKKSQRAYCNLLNSLSPIKTLKIVTHETYHYPLIGMKKKRKN